MRECVMCEGSRVQTENSRRWELIDGGWNDGGGETRIGGFFLRKVVGGCMGGEVLYEGYGIPRRMGMWKREAPESLTFGSFRGAARTTPSKYGGTVNPLGGGLGGKSRVGRVEGSWVHRPETSPSAKKVMKIVVDPFCAGARSSDISSIQ